MCGVCGITADTMMLCYCRFFTSLGSVCNKEGYKGIKEIGYKVKMYIQEDRRSILFYLELGLKKRIY